jgi:hypothetical protein
MKAKAFALTAAAFATNLLALAPVAAADKPVTTELNLDRTGTVPAGPNTCPFPFTFHTVGTLRQTVFSDGRVVTHAVSFKVTYTDPANGKQATTVLAGPIVVEPNGDGTVTVTINGNDGHLTAPGEGTVFAAVGKLVYIADASDPTLTPIAIVKSTGQQDESQFPGTCEALA